MARQWTVIEPDKRFLLPDLRELWQYRELLFFLVWRDIKIRYKQTVVGFGWAIIQPLLTMAIFTMVFTRIARVDSGGVPYPLFAYAALVPWTYFSHAVNRGAGSVVTNRPLITKVYFPRLLIPIAVVITPLFDLLVASLILVLFMVGYGFTPSSAALLAPLFLLLAVVTASAASLWVSALHVRYRDAGHLVGFLVTLWLWLSPVAYAASSVPKDWQQLYACNPMVGALTGFRWALLGTPPPTTFMLLAGGTLATMLFLGGLMYYRNAERSFADLI